MKINIAARSNIQWVLALLLITVIISIIILASVPPVSRDALTHHLAVPKLYLQHGGIYEMPSIEFSYYPMNLDLLYMIPLWFDNDILPKFIHFLFALLTAWLIYRYLEKRLDGSWALFGALFFLSLPIIIKLSTTVYVDLGLVFFSTAAILSIFRWIESQFQFKFLILSGVCCGLVLGTKYNGLVILFILTLFIPLIFIRNIKNKLGVNHSAGNAVPIKTQLKAVGYGAIFFTIALLVFSPWMIRNFVWKANPIYPLYDKVFNPHVTAPPNAQPGSQTLEPAAGAGSRQTTAAKSTRWSPFAIRKVIYGETWWEIALIPIRIFFQGQDDTPKYFDGRLNPFLFFLPILAFFHLNKNPATLRTEKLILIFFTVLVIFYAFSMTVIRIRYVAPIIPPLVILAIFGLHQLAAMIEKRGWPLSGKLASTLVLIIIGTMLSVNAAYIIKQFTIVKPFGFISGKVSREAYIAKYRPEFLIYQYANRNLHDSAKILGLFLGRRRYYSDRELIFGVNEFKKSIHRSESELVLLKDLRDKGFTHLIIRFDLFNPWANKQFNETKKKLLKFFFVEQTRPILKKDSYGLFELK
ncbi:MAG: phospholipid carrier-dependent glycosyltransferase [bacterium]|nr:phospholipid carrier-dependent glycosyltransferase [bacterium]